MFKGGFLNRLFYFCIYKDMKKKKQYIILGILFFLPVMFLLYFIPAKHNYIPLDIVQTQVKNINGVAFDTGEKVIVKDHISILVFLGNQPMKQSVAISNLKELIYDKFKGFKKFQIIAIAPEGTINEVDKLKSEIDRFGELKYWYYVFLSPEEIKSLYSSLKAEETLQDFGSSQAFIVDKDLNQRGRLDDREKREVEKKTPIYGLNSYDCIEVAQLKNKMSEDLRVLFTEYRQKRKGNFDSSHRRANEINQ